MVSSDKASPGANEGQQSRRQVFTEAERNILEAGKEVAEQKAALQAKKQQLRTQMEAQATTWERLQERAAEEETKISRRAAEAQAIEASANAAASAAQLEQSRTQAVLGSIQVEQVCIAQAKGQVDAEYLTAKAKDDELQRRASELSLRERKTQEITEECARQASLTQAQLQAEREAPTA